MIVSQQDGDFVKTTVYPSEVTAENVGRYTISLRL
jgi:hypothetical protein